MAKADLIKDAKKRGLKLDGGETVADLKKLLAAAGESDVDVDAEAGDAIDDIDADIAALKAQLSERMQARASAQGAAALTATQAAAEADKHVTDVAAQLEQDRRDEEARATQESLERSRTVGGATTPHGIHYGSGCI